MKMKFNFIWVANAGNSEIATDSKNEPRNRVDQLHSFII